MQDKQLTIFDSDDWFKPYNQPETLLSLAAKYKVSYQTFRKWIIPIQDKIHFKQKKTFTPSELKIIIEHLGEYNLD